MADGNALHRRRKGRPIIQAAQDGSGNKRRAQVRLAQQAYRSRNEAKLQSLSNRVQELETAMERINTSFLSLTDELIKNDFLTLYPALGLKVHQTIRQTLFFTNQAISAVDGDGDLDASAADDEGPKTRPKPDGPVQSPVQDIIPLQNAPHLHPLSLNAASAGKSFARRLYRACVEQGYRCLTDPSTEPETLARIFRLPLKMVTGQYIVAHFEAFLRYGQHLSPGELDLPFFSIGGAGTHFKHDQRSYTVQSSAPESGVVQLGVDQIDGEMRGEWFDCYDVEGYLASARIVADESFLIELLSTSCVCLGQAPGFARETVEAVAVRYTKAVDEIGGSGECITAGLAYFS
ncbi:hypothetical protein BJX99DRAFT_163461 [Aspergillus californicus]